MDATIESQPSERARAGFVFTSALRGALGRPAGWLFVWAVTTALALVPACARYTWLGSAIGQRYEPGSLVHSLDQSLDPEHPESSFRTDFADSISTLDAGAASYGALLALVMLLLFGPFAAGGWLQVVLERTQGHSMRRFLFGGARYFWRFFRLLIVTLLLLGLFGWVVYELPWKEYVLERRLGIPSFDLGALENLESEYTAVQLGWLQAGLFGLLFALTLTWGDYTRTRLALHDTRSVLAAGFKTLFTMLRHPIRTLRPMLLLLLVELAILVPSALVYDSIERGLQGSPTLARVLLLIAIGQLVFLWRAVTRGARYHAAAFVSADIVRPPSQTAAWSSSIGGPGGPRYPLEGSDEYGVSL